MERLETLLKMTLAAAMLAMFGFLTMTLAADLLAMGGNDETGSRGHRADSPETPSRQATQRRCMPYAVYNGASMSIRWRCAAMTKESAERD